MNREIKFRAWDNENKYMITSKQGIFTALRNSMNITVQDNGYYNTGDLLKPNKEKYTLMQYTGLKDKNGVEIYENMILDNKYIVLFENCKYILKDISNGDIIDLWRYMNENQGEITKKYSKI